MAPREWLENFLAFVSIILEFVLGAAVFYVIIHITHYLEQDIASMHETSGSPLYYVGNFGEIVFLIADCLIALFFVTRGIMNAWKATWGR
jgi:hypothetical protein